MHTHANTFFGIHICRNAVKRNSKWLYLRGVVKTCNFRYIWVSNSVLGRRYNLWHLLSIHVVYYNIWPSVVSSLLINLHIWLGWANWFLLYPLTRYFSSLYPYGRLMKRWKKKLFNIKMLIKIIIAWTISHCVGRIRKIVIIFKKKKLLMKN